MQTPADPAPRACCPHSDVQTHQALSRRATPAQHSRLSVGLVFDNRSVKNNTPLLSNDQGSCPLPLETNGLDCLLSCLPSGPTVRGSRQRPRRRVTDSGTARSLGVPASASVLTKQPSYPRVSTLAPRLLRELSDASLGHVVGVWGISL